MVKTRVQIPDELYLRAKRVAKQNEWSFAEVVRRGLECITQVNPFASKTAHWCLPKPANMGQSLMPDQKWTGACHD